MYRYRGGDTSPSKQEIVAQARARLAAMTPKERDQLATPPPKAKVKQTAPRASRKRRQPQEQQKRTSKPMSEPIDVGPEALDLLTVDQVAKRLKLAPKTIRQLIWKQELEAVRIGRAVRVAPEAVLEYKQRLRAKAKGSAA